MRIYVRVKPWIAGLQYTGDRSGALSALALFFCLPRAAQQAATGLSLALGFFDVAPSALETEAPSHKWPNSKGIARVRHRHATAEATPLQALFL